MGVFVSTGFGFRSLCVYDEPLGIDRLIEVAEPAGEIDARSTIEHFDRTVEEAAEGELLPDPLDAELHEAVTAAVRADVV